MSLDSSWKEEDGIQDLVKLKKLKPKKCSQFYLLFIAEPYQYQLKEKKINLFINVHAIRLKTEEQHMSLLLN
jgi:hypothetical protein